VRTDCRIFSSWEGLTIRSPSIARIIRGLTRYLRLRALSDAAKRRARKADACFEPLDYISDNYIEQLNTILAYRSGNPQKLSQSWHLDPVTCFEFGRGSSWLIDIRPFKGNDLRSAWESSMFQVERDLLLTGLISGNEWIQQVTDWIVSNPVGCGINWISPMVAAIRAVNWILAYSCIPDSIRNTKDGRILEELILVHGAFLGSMQEIKKTGLTTNHTTAVWAGLIFVALAFPGYPGSEEWLSTAVKGFSDCIRTQTRADGTNFEGSTGYHRLILDICLHSMAVLRFKGVDLDTEIEQTIMKMMTAHRYMLDSGGNLPQVGDCDGGMWLTPACRVTGLLHSELICGSLDKGARLPAESPVLLDDDNLCLFSDSGIAVSRLHPLECRIFCMPIGQDGLGGHNHEDHLQICISAAGHQLVVDAGTGNYNRSYQQRLYFRSREAHSIPFFQALPGPYRYRKDGPFDLENTVSMETFLSVSMDGDGHEILGRVSYSGLTIERFIKSDGSIVTISDHFLSQGVSNEPVSQYLIHPDWSISYIDRGLLITRQEICLLMRVLSGEVTVEKTLWSPCYDMIEETNLIRIKPQQDSPNLTRVKFEIRKEHLH